jgi:hypothetical protein
MQLELKLYVTFEQWQKLFTIGNPQLQLYSVRITI